MNDDDREELLWRRLSHKVAEGVDQEIKSRYFWAALLFAGVSWFGGSALISGIIESRVAEQMKPADRALTAAKVLADELAAKLMEANKRAAKMDELVEENRRKLTDLSIKENNLDHQLADVKSNVESAIGPINESLKSLRNVVAQSDVGQDNDKAGAVAKLSTAQVAIRVGADIPPGLVARLSTKIASSGKYSVSAEGGRVFTATSSVRYFYKGDESLARDVAAVSAEALGQNGVEAKAIPIIDLSGLPIKPPERTVEMWLNVSNGRLL